MSEYRDYKCEECPWEGNGVDTIRMGHEKEDRTLYTMQCPECGYILVQGKVDKEKTEAIEE